MGGAGLRARQYGPMATAEGRPTGLPTFLTPTRFDGIEADGIANLGGPLLQWSIRPPRGRQLDRAEAILVGLNRLP